MTAFKKTICGIMAFVLTFALIAAAPITAFAEVIPANDSRVTYVGRTMVEGTDVSFDWTANTIPTGSDVTATKTTLGTAIDASLVTTSDVTVATGSKTTANAITGFGTHTTATCLTGVKVSAQPTVTLVAGETGDVTVATDVTNSAISVSASGDTVTAMTGATATAPTVTLNNSGATGVAFVDTVTIGSTSATVSGTAAAQTWTQKSGSTGAPV